MKGCALRSQCAIPYAPRREAFSDRQKRQRELSFLFAELLICLVRSFLWRNGIGKTTKGCPAHALRYAGHEKMEIGLGGNPLVDGRLFHQLDRFRLAGLAGENECIAGDTGNVAIPCGPVSYTHLTLPTNSLV